VALLKAGCGLIHLWRIKLSPAKLKFQPGGWTLFENAFLTEHAFETVIPRM
jgi:hypothetical protein